MSRKRWAGLALAALLFLISLPAAFAESPGMIELEQVYLNAPQCRYYIYAYDNDGATYDPSLLGLAGVQLSLDDTQLQLLDIQQADDPVCFVYILDKGSDMDHENFEAAKRTILRQISAMHEGDQALVFAAGADPLLIADRNTSYEALERYFSKKLVQEDQRAALAKTLSYAGDYLDRHFQELNPRKVGYVFADSAGILQDVTLLGAMKKDNIRDMLGMTVHLMVFGLNDRMGDTVTSLSDTAEALHRVSDSLRQVEDSLDQTMDASFMPGSEQENYRQTADDLDAAQKNLDAAGDSLTGLSTGLSAAMNRLDGILSFLLDLPTNSIVSVTADTVGETIDTLNAQLETALAVTARVDASVITGQVKLATLSLPNYKLNYSKYVMAGHVMPSPAVETVDVLSQNLLQITFNRRVSGVEERRAYLVRDSIGRGVPVRSAAAQEDGSVLLTTDNLYDGGHSIRLRGGWIRDLQDPSNKVGTVPTPFTVDMGLKPDALFYLEYAKGPALLLAVFVFVYIFQHLFLNKKERRREAEAQAETVLGLNGKENVEDTWFGLDYDGDGVVDEYVHDSFSGERSQVERFCPKRENLPLRRVKLLVSIGKQTSRSVKLSIEGSSMLGADPALCDLALEGQNISPQHAVLYPQGKHLMAMPVGDAPVLLNDKPLTDPKPVPNGARLTIGDCTIKLLK